MKPEVADSGWLWDMLSAARLVMEFVRGRTFDEYQADPMLRSAVERQIEIIGEAASRVSTEFQDSHPEFEWRKIVGQRPMLAHGYGKLDHELVWKAAIFHVPELAAKLAPLVPPPPDSPPTS